ncbi:MAG: type I asparaginase [Paramuribaculum sp.]|jgi:L-asparaginase|uniref:asparaginase n=1 Tax=Paramuribaculum intestinale TaxID=2094151 RepID=UPI00273032A8|nr:type I asparaginase [Paramuribaculum intestinale]MCX4332359.1 type I asparaginase [Paramuribaculum sp.]
MAAAQPRILLIYTGGTIGMIEDAETHTLRPFDFTHLIDNVPKIKMLNYVIDNISFNPPIDSSDMNPTHWEQIAEAIRDNYDRYDGFVVLHGTDTMAYSASALSFMLHNLRKPVIITGSQLPIGEVRTDGEENLITAVQVAAAMGPDEKPKIQEVAILFENYLWRGNRSTKISADNFNAFKSNNYPRLAKIGLDIIFNDDALYRLPPDAGEFSVSTSMDPSVMAIDLFPGITETVLRHALATPGVKGVVLKTYGAGNAPTSPWFTNAISDAIKSGMIVMNVTQCINGSVQKLYLTGDRLAATGVISGHDITPEAALTKMMYLFALGISHDQVVQGLRKPLCGEMSLSPRTMF